MNNNNGAIKSITIYTNDDILHYSYHKCQIADVTLHTADSFVAGKQSRYRVHKLVPKMEMIEDKEVDVNETNRIMCHNSVKLDRSDKIIATGQQNFVIENIYRNKHRQLNMDAYESGLFESLEKGLVSAVEQTKAQPIITSSELE